MEIRKIQKTGGKSFSITLPKNWINENSIKNKDKIKIKKYKNLLIISPLKKIDFDKFVSVKIDNFSRKQIFREIIGYYLSGVENIIIKSEKITYQQRSAVREISYKLIGCECLEGISNKILLKIIIENNYSFINEYLKKIILIINSMFEDTIKSLKNKNYELSNDIIERDVEIDRLHLAINRFFNKKIINHYREEFNEFSFFDLYYILITSLRIERIADHIVKINKSFNKIKKKEFNLNYYERRILKETFNNLLKLEKIILQKQKKDCHEYLDYFDNTKYNIFERITKKKYLNLIIEESLNRINSYVANIAEETINYLNVKETEY